MNSTRQQQSLITPDSNIMRRVVSKETLSKFYSICPPFQTGVFQFTSDHWNCFREMNSPSKKAGAFFFQFKADQNNDFQYLPQGCVTMIFNCSNPEDSIFIGLQTEMCNTISLKKDNVYFGVDLYSIFGMSGNIMYTRDLLNAVVGFNDVFPGDDLPELISSTKGFFDRIEVFKIEYNTMIDDKYVPGLAEECAVLLCNSGGNIHISELEAETLYTKRYIQQKFTDQYGISPKLYGRIRRFHQALLMMAWVRTKSTSYIAAENGYYDQSHFIKEFKYFTSYSPERYIKQCLTGEERL